MIEDPQRKVLYKTSIGVEFKPVLIDEATKTNQTYYYIWYSFNEGTNKWVIETNRLLFGECTIMAYCDSKEEAASKTALINQCIHKLISNGVYENIYPLSAPTSN